MAVGPWDYFEGICEMGTPCYPVITVPQQYSQSGIGSNLSAGGSHQVH